MSSAEEKSQINNNDTGSISRQRLTSARTRTRPTDEEEGLVNSSTSTSTPSLLGPPEQTLVEKTSSSASIHHEGLRDGELPPAAHLFWDRFTRKGKRTIGVGESLRTLAFSSWLNVFLVFIPLAWIAHFVKWSDATTFSLCFLAIIPLEKLFDFGGEQMGYYVGKDLGDLIVITLNNAVEATLAIILLAKCELKLLQSTIVGVVILHLLLIPGTSFITGGARIWEQNLYPYLTQLNQTLLTIGVLTLLLPAAFFVGLDQGVISVAEGVAAQNIVNDVTRDTFLRISRGLAVVLLVVYLCSRIFVHNPPGDNNALREHPTAPAELRAEELHLASTDPEVNQYVLIAMLLITIAIMAATAEWLVDSVEFVREEGGIQEEWFGLILLPVVSFAADGAIAVAYFLRSSLRMWLGDVQPPATLARARAIDLSIQFTLFWMPFIVLLGWWNNKPMHLLFDIFEVALLIGACFLVNYVTADAKTNWAEGMVLVAFYIMIAICAWFYTGQPELEFMLACSESVADALASGSGGEE